MKITCDLIQDLLPLYCDGVCSEDSRRVVEEHLQSCTSCSADHELMRADFCEKEVRTEEKQAASAAAAAWKRGKNRSFLKGCLIVMLLIAVMAGGYSLIHWSTTVKADDLNAMAAQAAKYLGHEKLYIVETEQRGNYLAALCKKPDGNWCMCVFDRDTLFQDRWRANGGKKSLESGSIGSWNYGSPQNEAILIFCGGDLSEDISWYQFHNSGITYTCPVESDTILDVFIIPDQSNINGHPILLDAEQQEIR